MASLSDPIGIFDSGLGGLTVCRAIEKALPDENLIYVGDTARVPYGVKSAETVTRYSQEICDFLIQQGVKAIVVACNTASALALPQLQERYSLPMIGVLTPGVQAALKLTQSGSIGVIGTEGTIYSESYQQALLRAKPQLQVRSQACPLFVPLVEAGWIDHEVTRRVAEIYLGPWREASVDALILGCTHYPLLKSVLQETLGTGVRLVDSALETANYLTQTLQAAELLAPEQNKAECKYYSTDAPEKMQSLAKRFLGHQLESVEFTNLGIA